MNRKIWIDLDNSPHVPFFKPIMEELAKRDFEFVITARDCFQVCGLADLLKVKYKRIGKHYGKNKVMKVLGLLFRSIQVIPTILREKPSLAVSHGSRTQVLVSALLKIPCVMIFDYEYARGLKLFQPSYLIAPEILADSLSCDKRSHASRYPGIKEDVYIPGFKPAPGIRERIGIGRDDIVATVRPPASEAHYHNPESEILFNAAIEVLAEREKVKIVILPRNDKQAEHIRARWPHLFLNRKIIIPHQVVDGLNLIWHSDLVISGGGTMNREAAALGVPVYSIFRGKIGAVDRYLAEKGRLTLLESAEDVRSKIHPVRRPERQKTNTGDRTTLDHIVNTIQEAFENNRAMR